MQRGLNALNLLSLRLKLMLGYALIFSLSVMVGALIVFVAARSTLTHSLDANLRDTAQVAQSGLSWTGSQPHFSATFQPSAAITAELLSSTGTRLVRAGNPAVLPALPLRLGTYKALGRRVFTTALARGLLLRVSRASDSLDEVVELLGRMLVLGSAFMIVVACAAGYLLADRALRPVDAVVSMAERIAAGGQYAERVAVSPGRDEMARLTLTVNRMLDRLEGSIEREKEFARTAAHELRTPLTTLKGRLDLALERPRDEETLRKTLLVMRNRVQSLIALSEGLLELARTDTPPLLVPLELGAATLSVAERLHDSAQHAGRRLELDIEESWILAEMPGLQVVIDNLLSNALKYGGAAVQVRVQGQTLSICDSGPGPLEHEWARLLRPFERGTGVQNVPGSGLGLALVHAHVQRWPATLKAQWQADGFAVSVVWNQSGERVSS